MAEDTADDRGDDATPPSDDVEAALGAAVDDALADEVRRQKRRFVQGLMDLDRHEGVGRDDGRRNDSTYRDLDPGRRDDPEA
ncbi:hypothetical protein [Actinomycetospora chibensis]|uniref:Uncharacterized protein n=1 Tax=Actinomycetospora chibensis TaxID=663606 RepID=A0ABV9RNJ7_9PSEU|nr:hypothetical protein [Actinomycetospora chibensis]MDD7922668.1 hypothetical protein [Actinomycetospora chibensis]